VEYEILFNKDEIELRDEANVADGTSNKELILFEEEKESLIFS
jgi:hypothetical protein